MNFLYLCCQARITCVLLLLATRYRQPSPHADPPHRNRRGIAVAVADAVPSARADSPSGDRGSTLVTVIIVVRR